MTPWHAGLPNKTGLPALDFQLIEWINDLIAKTLFGRVLDIYSLMRLNVIGISLWPDVEEVCMLVYWEAVSPMRSFPLFP